jgi:UDP-N-acetylmuramyl pentapeptide phosphotransferase/UDP-N-acetylglucosamine-1-phosphate transferase
MQLFLISTSSFLISYLVCYLIIKNIKLNKIFRDIPNDRSMHSKITPRSGGLVILFVFFFILNINDLQDYNKYFVILSPLVFINLIDDYKSISFLYKLFIQLIVLFFFFYSNNYELSVLTFFIFLFSLWFINSINFADGINGFVSTYFFIGFLFLSFFSHSNELSIFFYALSFSVLGFIFHNIYKGNIFLGDVGSVCIACLALIVTLNSYTFNDDFLYLFYLYFLPILSDTTLTFFKRILNNENIFHPHRNHFYQKLYLFNISHFRVIFMYIFHSFINIVLYFLFISYLPNFLLALIITLFSLIVFLFVNKVFLYDQLK